MSIYENDLSLIEEDILDIIQEAPGDDESGGETVDAGADDNAGGNEGNDNQNADDNANNDEGNEDQNAGNDENKGDQENDDNFDIDTEGGDDENAGEDEGGEGTEDAGDAGTEEGDAEAEETDAEKERNSAFDKIYDELTPAEKQRRDSVLRHQYQDLYIALGGIINDTSQFPNTSNTNKTIRLLIRNLRDFREYINFYMTDIYSSKSHLENKIQYDTFIQIFHAVEKIYKDLATAMGHEYDSYGRKVSELNTKDY